MATSKQRIDVTVGFQADMSQMKGQISSLKQSLSQLMTASVTGNSTQGFTERLKAAQTAAQQLDLALTRAFNKDTGKINITKFTQSLKSSGTSVQQISSQLVNAGKQGTQTFLQMAQALQNVERSAITVNSVVSKFATTLYNNVRWQASSALLNVFTTQVSNVVSHLKEMDNPLNAIRVVTGDTKAQMKGVADEAYRMAKNLKTSATEIVNAELIYRQQGDSAELAAKKAEITTKAANISFNSSAQQMSEYLTAIWNSYQVPEDQLELFVDKIAKIGATTATSMEEIATAMQKVAAAGNAAGVSYDQLAAIIATVSSVTRQSAETVGTSFKTVFARLADLKAGKTAEDGITLGNVTQELYKLGIDVRGANGGLKETGDLVNELGEKWTSLSKTEQQAISQTIGGTRQYVMWTALMDNWDMYKDALTEAMNAEGTLNEQQDIWAESWEAHAQAVQVSWEGLYNSLVKADSFLKGMDSLSWLIDRLTDISDAAGGLGNILLWLGTTMATKLTPQIMNMVNSAVSNFDILTGAAKKREIQAQTELATQLKQISTSAAYTGAQKLEAQFLAQNTEAKRQYLQIEDTLSNKQKEEIASLGSVAEGWQNIALKTQEAIDADKKYLEGLSKERAVAGEFVATEGGQSASVRGRSYTRTVNGETITTALNKQDIAQVASASGKITDVYGSGAKYKKLAAAMGATEKQLAKFNEKGAKSKEVFIEIAQSLGYVTPKMEDFSKAFNAQLKNFTTQNQNFGKIKSVFEGMSTEQLKNLDTSAVKQQIKELGISFSSLSPEVQSYVDNLEKGKFTLEDFSQATEKSRKTLANYIAKMFEAGYSIDEVRQHLIDIGMNQENAEKAIRGATEAIKKQKEEMEKAAQTAKITQGFTGAISAITSATMAVQTFYNTLDNWDSTDTLSKITSITMALGMLPGVFNGIRAAVEAFSLSVAATNIVTAALTAILIALIAAFKASQYFSLEGAVDRLKESEEKVKSIKTELEGIDQQIEDLEKKGSNINDQEWDTLQALKQQRIEKQAMLELEKNSAGKTREDVIEALEGKEPPRRRVSSRGRGIRILPTEFDFTSVLKNDAFYAKEELSRDLKQSTVDYWQARSQESGYKTNQAIYSNVFGSQINQIKAGQVLTKQELAEVQKKIESGEWSVADPEKDIFKSSNGETTPETEQKRKKAYSVAKSFNKLDDSKIREFQSAYYQRVKENYKAIKDLDYVEGDNLTSTEKEFNQKKLETTVNYFAALAHEAENAEDKIIQTDRALDYFEATSENMSKNTKIEIMDSDDYENLSSYVKVLDELKDINPTLVQSYKDRIAQEKESYKATKQLAKEMGITLDSYDQLDAALSQMAQQTGIPQSVIQSLYDSGAMADFASSELGSLKGALDRLANTTVDASGFVTGLDGLTAQAVRALAAILSLADLEVRWEGPELPSDYQGIMKGAPTGGSISSTQYVDFQEKGFDLSGLKAVVYKKGVGRISGDGTSLGDILKKELNNIWGTSSGGGGSGKEPGTNPPGGNDSSSKKDADKVWWDAYEAARKQLDEQYEAGVLTQDQYLEAFDKLYEDLINHYNGACEEHKAKILEEMNDLREANAQRNLELYETMVDTILDYGSVTMTYKGQQISFSSIAALDAWADENLWNQTIKNPKTGEEQSVYNKDDRDQIAQKQWDTAKETAQRTINRLNNAFDNEELDYDSYLQQLSSLYYGSAYSPDIEGNKRFFTDEEIDNALGASQQDSWFEKQLQRYADEYNQNWIDGKGADVNATYQKLLAFWKAHPERHNKNTRATLVSVIQSLKKQAKENIQKEEDLGWIDAYIANDARSQVDYLGLDDFEELRPQLGSDLVSSYQSFEKARENRLSYGDYIEGTDKELQKTTYLELMQVAGSYLKEVAATAGVESDEFIAQAQKVKDAAAKYLNAVFSFEEDFSAYKEKSNLLGWKNGDSELKASLRLWANTLTTGVEGIVTTLINQGYRLEDAYAFLQQHLTSNLQQLQSAALAQAQQDKEDALETYNQIKAELENTVSGRSKNFEYQKTLRDSLHEINKELATSLTMYDYLDEDTRKLLFNTEDYLVLSEKINELQEEGNALTEQYLEDIQGKSTEEQELITQAYEAQMELKSKEYEIAKQDLEVTKKKLALQNVLNERNTRMFLNGQWTWVANQEEVAQAQQDLMDAKYQAESARLELEFATEQEKLNKKVRDTQETINKINETFEDFQDMINNKTKKIGLKFDDFSESIVTITQSILSAREEFEEELEGLQKDADYAKYIKGRENDDGSIILDEGYVASTKNGQFYDMGDYYNYYSPSSPGGVWVKRGTLTKHALGGIFNTPHLAQVSEDGAEAIIPLTDKYKKRGLDLWLQAGQILGAMRPAALPSINDNNSNNINQNVIVNIHNDDSSSDFYEINNLV